MSDDGDYDVDGGDFDGDDIDNDIDEAGDDVEQGDNVDILPGRNPESDNDSHQEASLIQLVDVFSKV